MFEKEKDHHKRYIETMPLIKVARIISDIVGIQIENVVLKHSMSITLITGSLLF